MDNIVQIVVPLLVVAGGAWLTSRLASRRSHDEKLWEQKLEAYSTIFLSLYELEKWYSHHWNKWFLEGIGEDATGWEDEYFTHDYYLNASETLFRTVAKTQWMVSPEVSKLFDELKRVMEGGHKDFLDRIINGRNAVLETQEKLKKTAERELGRAGAARLPGSS